MWPADSTSSRAGILVALLPASAQASPDSGSARDSPASCAGLPEVPGPRGDGSGGGAALRGLDCAEEVEPEAFPVPVLVRGAAAAAAGAAMPKGGEARALVARGPRGAPRVRLQRCPLSPLESRRAAQREDARAG